jgi:hypothetical protein
MLERCEPLKTSNMTNSRLRPREILNSLSCNSSVRRHSRTKNNHRAAAPGPCLNNPHHLNDTHDGRDTPSLERSRRVRGSLLKDAGKVGITELSVLVTLQPAKRPLGDVRVRFALEILDHFLELWDRDRVRGQLVLFECPLCPAFVWLRNSRVPW